VRGADEVRAGQAEPVPPHLGRVTANLYHARDPRGRAARPRGASLTMCGRYALKASLPEIARILGAETAMSDAPRYNIAPTQDVPVCRTRDAQARDLVPMRWGLVPAWSKDPANAYRMINARAETVAEKPAFRSAFRRRRCLVPADGYYEWQRARPRKQPYFIHMKDGRPFCFAGLWETWRPEEGEPLHSCAIITTEANEIGKRVHDRMPVILEPGDYDRWLDPRAEAGALVPLLRPFPDEAMSLYPVSTLVNNPRNDDERCLEPLADAPGG